MMRQLINVFYPPHCLVCSCSLSQDCPQHAQLCNHCNPILNCNSSDSLNGHLLSEEAHLEKLLYHAGIGIPSSREQASSLICCKCGEPSSTIENSKALCVACRVWPPPMSQLRSLWNYSSQSEAVVKALKYKGKRPLVHFLAAAMANAVVGFPSVAPIFDSVDWDLIVPLPSSPQNIRNRGYNHMGLVARALSKQLAIRADLSSLRSTRERSAQVLLPPVKRHQNLQNAFRVHGRRLQNKKILLIDDVITTGASLWSAAWCLVEEGAQQVDALTITRSQQFGRLRLLGTSSPNAQDSQNKRQAHA